MTPVLLDINVLIALAWPSHVHHERATNWFAARKKARFATCPTTQAGFLRVCSNRAVLPEATSPREALALLREITEMRGHVFWSDATDFTRSAFVVSERLVGHRQITDSHLLAIALAHGGRLGTFDRGIQQLAPATLGREAIDLIE